MPLPLGKDGIQSGWGLADTEMKSVGMGADVFNFYPQASL